jgi:hypothetical protein
MDTSRSTILSENFKEALADYHQWLEKNYPQKTVLKLVGDRYALSGIQRTMLYRGIAVENQDRKRTEKITDEEGVKRQIIHIDGYNVLITIGSYLNGNTVFISTDGLLRDTTESHGTLFKAVIINKTLDLLIKYLQHLSITSTLFYLDSPVKGSDDIFRSVSTRLHENNISGKALLYESPDHYIKTASKGIIASSDTGIVDSSSLKIFDLSYHCLRHHFHPDFIDLRTLTYQK